ncbi:MAG: 1-(5-phosphoribosyl)-5-[(5-phosphoribosylamino)methylideneamino]imidazole-4-carboxamide isomerase [Planctomycetota bacterium]|jgi:phosphoribosylformimino-5-aminoimidazole carboxamide ribotide isomerase|nr:1-(5-phosphoribosyl)-5-[(5-phosphoribosylamino)methylideneamino]imidazole-4-carboxamide isomerase [Planctomycetota bacterium]MDP7130184.1 1-(5-phosphoribosyl)-5-[(5-phosphoribosylamino)methylideneamino]imidazole-4-carboxamide isomerase [Planctomycetota bacterium]MDP7248413.1 1-(5-phosphoribosyl)-5-[(5-phosphoribosylamino)methylideneamino]imidazole-4-carboxamide isomerase [Planctomycetota bacterium]
MLIYPAIDLKDGKCVRLRQGRADDTTVFSEQPEDMAQRWQDKGAEFLHVVDLDGAFEGRPANIEAIARIASAVEIPIQVGGGIRTDEAAGELIDLGISRLIIGTAALREPEWFADLARTFEGKIAVGIDAQNGKVAIKGWVEVSETTVFDFLPDLEALPLSALIYTDISKDGMMAGPNFESTEEVATKTSIPVIASGGVTTIEDVKRLSMLPLNGMIIGRAIYEGTIELEEAIRVARK